MFVHWIVKRVRFLWQSPAATPLHCGGGAPRAHQHTPLLWSRNESFEHIPLLADLESPAPSHVTLPPGEPLSAGLVTTSGPENPRRPFLFAARLRSVSKLNSRKDRKRRQPALKAGRIALKRAPQLFPVKRKGAVAKRPATKIIVATPMRPSAIIIVLPTGAHRAALVKVRRAA